MAFCNSCGSLLAPGAQACARCGSAVAAASPAAPPAASVAQPTPRSSATKVILIVVGAVVGIVVICVACLAFIAYHFAHQSHITKDGDSVKMEAPFGTIETTKDPAVAAKNLGVELYPGAELDPNGAASTSIAGTHAFAGTFESTDSAGKVCEFYESKFPKATLTASDASGCKIVSTSQDGVITIKVTTRGGNTLIQISNVSHPKDR